MWSFSINCLQYKRRKDAKTKKLNKLRNKVHRILKDYLEQHFKVDDRSEYMTIRYNNHYNISVYVCITEDIFGRDRIEISFKQFDFRGFTLYEGYVITCCGLTDIYMWMLWNLRLKRKLAKFVGEHWL